MKINKIIQNMRGFTLMEMMVVMMIISVLAAIAMPSYRRHQIKARETVLLEDLYQMRSAIDAYFSDKGQYPNQLDELITGHYLRALPRDPFTKDTESWSCVAPEPTDDGELVEGGCFDVKSGSDQVGTDGQPYSDW